MNRCNVYVAGICVEVIASYLISIPQSQIVSAGYRHQKILICNTIQNHSIDFLHTLRIRSGVQFCENFRILKESRELAEEIKKNEKLCALLEDKLQAEANVDENETNSITEVAGRYNIYAYDIIYCAHAYNLYGDIPVRKKTKLSSIEQKKQDRQIRIQELASQRDEAKEQIEQVDAQLKENSLPDLTGMTVKNIRYGAGTVAEQSGKYLTVEFSAGTKKFVLPDAVAKGFLKIEDADTMGSFEKIGLLTERKEKYTREIEMLTTEITRLSQIK